MNAVHGALSVFESERADKLTAVSLLLAGRRAIVTGAAGGIGEAVARRFCEEGAQVVLADRDGDGAIAAAGQLGAAGHRAHGRQLDVTDEAAVRAAIDDAAELLGGLDLVVANAGVLSVTPLAELSSAEFERTLRVNAVGTFLTLKHAVPHLRAAGGGALLCTASQAGVHGYPDMSAYCASKFAVVGMVKSLAQELAGDGIRVCAVAPGLINTAMYRELAAKRARMWSVDVDTAAQRLVDTVPFRRPARPEEVADAFVYLASSAASYVSGIALVVDAAELSG
jgi:NAD(P)-dependent dehydrogenase (short-subunit alcohol dehydrogenase family)